MRNKRFKRRNRRQNIDMPGVPYRDSHGEKIKECRRKIPDRRIDSIQAALVNIINRDHKADTKISNNLHAPATS
jgi:hypothetical protein